ncbi:DUF4177 domain-containing protein [Mangrovimonas aestuarii]|uniref:DUF4177 domain-containing protein n=1 Tax=Mangrovimonas aestuarii TaxID=3018443 RepID=UPI002379E739|nr:DUF4177 domain-containing protein [Mangrovimonas aestuarii]
MKEYKVVESKLGFRDRTHKLENLLNEYARTGWALTKTIVPHGATYPTLIIFERNKNR